jgi:hypothetical protein
MKQETSDEFNALSRADKLTLLKDRIETTRIALEESQEKNERMRLYSELGSMLLILEDVKMNKTNSSHFSFTPSNTYSRKQRRQMMKSQSKGKPRY